MLFTMKAKAYVQSIILFIFLCGFILLTGYLRDQVGSQNSKLWISLGSTTILAMAVVINLYFKEKLLQKPSENMGKISAWTSGTADRIVDIIEGKGEQWLRMSTDYRKHTHESKY